LSNAIVGRHGDVAKFVVLAGLGVITISTFVLCGVVLYGLRGAK
jgi:hypothetical protein